MAADGTCGGWNEAAARVGSLHIGVLLGSCHCFVTTDVLVKGLSGGAIDSMWKLEGVGRNRKTQVLPRFGPSWWR